MLLPHQQTIYHTDIEYIDFESVGKQFPDAYYTTEAAADTALLCLMARVRRVEDWDTPCQGYYTTSIGGIMYEACVRTVILNT